MKPESVDRHLQEVLGLVQAVKHVLSGSEATAYTQREIAAGSVILEEGDRNETVFIILDGTVHLSTVREQEIVELDRLGRATWWGSCRSGRGSLPWSAWWRKPQSRPCASTAPNSID